MDLVTVLCENPEAVALGAVAGGVIGTLFYRATIVTSVFCFASIILIGFCATNQWTNIETAPEPADHVLAALAAYVIVAPLALIINTIRTETLRARKLKKFAR